MRTRLALAELARTELMRTELARVELVRAELVRTKELARTVARAGPVRTEGRLAGPSIDCMWQASRAVD